MAVPLTSDLPGTSSEAGGNIQVRSKSRGAASLGTETSFQVADCRKRVREVRAGTDWKVESGVVHKSGKAAGRIVARIRDDRRARPTVEAVRSIRDCST